MPHRMQDRTSDMSDRIPQRISEYNGMYIYIYIHIVPYLYLLPGGMSETMSNTQLKAIAPIAVLTSPGNH